MGPLVVRRTCETNWFGLVRIPLAATSCPPRACPEERSRPVRVISKLEHGERLVVVPLTSALGSDLDDLGGQQDHEHEEATSWEVP